MWHGTLSVRPRFSHARGIPLTDHITSLTGQGARSCTGRPLAEMEMLLVISTLVRNFRLRLHESTTDASMRYAPAVACVISPRLL